MKGLGNRPASARCDRSPPPACFGTPRPYISGWPVIIEESPGSPADVRAAERVLVELLQLEREVAELEYMRRADALERAAEAIRRLGELGSSDGILGRAAAELGACCAV